MSFILAETVPEDHLVRDDSMLLSIFPAFRSELAPHYSMKKPSIDPELMIRMLVVCLCDPLGAIDLP